MNLTGIANLQTVPENAVWFRAILPGYWNTALQTSQTTTFPTRFDSGPTASPQFEILYVAQDPIVALFEVQAMLGSAYGPSLPQPAKAWISLNVNVVLQTVADLTTSAAQLMLAATVQELTGDWLGYQQRHRSLTLNQPTGLAPTQSLGAALFAVPGLEAFKTVSAKVTDKRVLVIFPQKLRIGSSVQFQDALTMHQQTIQGTQP
jgi:RES domain